MPPDMTDLSVDDPLITPVGANKVIVLKEPIAPLPQPLTAPAQDPVLFAVVLGLVAFGVVMVYSASAVYAAQKFGSATYFLRRDLLWTFFGLTAMTIAAPPKNMPTPPLVPPAPFMIVRLLWRVGSPESSSARSRSVSLRSFLSADTVVGDDAVQPSRRQADLWARRQRACRSSPRFGCVYAFRVYRFGCSPANANEAHRRLVATITQAKEMVVAAAVGSPQHR